ncbi:putative RNA-directed DNA polymerase [Rosa chinensis]|uniref:Putative RNA-directed DNA polymerase n=1 Tax=Rosa chinensis TaxID=74649 RepID=A0A2P6RUH6_ROSCH|nr:putative RNA-directed DNA polymerase [Rosa chinensis]
MASTTSSPSPTQPTPNPSPIFPLTPGSSSAMQVQNLGPVIPVRLTETNYLLWKSVFLPVLHKYHLLSIVDGSEPCPPEKVLSPSGELILNDAFVSWFERDQQLLIWINSTLSDSVLPYVIGCSHARDLWLNLEARFAGLSQAHLLHLKARLQTAKKGSLSMTAYLQLLKGYADSLAALGAPVSDSDLVAYCLQGLTEEYSAFATALRTRMGILPVTSAELHNLLLSEEIILEDRKQLNLEASAPVSAFAATPIASHGGARGGSNFRGRSRHPNFRGGARGGSFTSASSRPRIQCQICERQGHSAIDCYNRMNHAFVGRIPPAKLSALFAAPTTVVPPPSPSATLPTPVAFNTQPSSQTPSVHPPYSPTSPGFNFYSAPVANSSWLADSGASQHVTPDLSQLSDVTPYYGFGASENPLSRTSA